MLLFASVAMSTAAPDASCDTDLAKDVRSFAAKPELSASLASAVAAAAAASDQSKPFTVAVSGGSLPKLLAAGILDAAEGSAVKTIDWSRWQIFFADERLVALDDDDSNFKACYGSLFEKVGVPRENIHTIDASLEVEAAAKDYEAKLQSVFGAEVPAPVFDLILLGMGPDGHTASLFPGHALLDYTASWVASIADSPKPPPRRITLSLPVLNAAKNVYFVCTGAGKSPNLAKVLGVAGTDEPMLPAGRVQPTDGQLVWFVDNDAAADYAAISASL